MKKLTYLTIVLIFAGCAVKTERNFNFAPHLPEVEQRQIVGDMVKKLSEIYPPAKTQLSLQLSDQDSFGPILVHDLREQGYAVQEWNQEPSKDSSGLPVCYILDQADALYRITVTIGSDSLSRPYSEQNGVLTPAGYWVHKGNSHE
jgi:type IV secretion system protein TrbH